jgi:hypothetical protein
MKKRVNTYSVFDPIGILVDLSMTHRCDHSHHPSDSPQTSIRSTRYREVERVGHHGTIRDDPGTLTEILEDQSRINQADKGDPDGRCRELAQVGAMWEIIVRGTSSKITHRYAYKMASHPVSAKSTPASAS